MEEIIINGGHRLQGTVEIDGAKNAILPIMAASLLATEGVTEIDDVPILADVYTMSAVLESLAAEVAFDKNSQKLQIGRAHV